MKRWLITIIVALIFIAGVLATEASWQGTDDTVVGSMAQKAGVQAGHILPWQLNGDLQLFVFCAGGAVAGFLLGYYWRKLFGSEEKGRAAGDARTTSDSAAVGGGEPRA